MFTLENFGQFWIIISKVGGKLWRREGYMEQYLSDQNQLHIFDNDNFSIIPKSIFSDIDNLPISCKNADLSAVDNFFDNIAHPYSQVSLTKCRAGFLKTILASPHQTSSTWYFHKASVCVCVWRATLMNVQFCRRANVEPEFILLSKRTDMHFSIPI